MPTGFDLLKLVVTADHAGGDAFDAAGGDLEVAGADTVDDVGGDWFAFAFEGELAVGGNIEEAADMLVGIVTDEDGAVGGGGFEAAGEVDGVADSGKFASGTDFAEEDSAGIDADAEGELSRFAFNGVVVDNGLHGKSGANSEFGVIFSRLIDAPEGHDAIAEMFVDMTIAGNDKAVNFLPEVIDDMLDIFGVHLVGHGGKA